MSVAACQGKSKVWAFRHGPLVGITIPPYISDQPDLSDSPHNYNETGSVRLGLVLSVLPW